MVFPREKRPKVQVNLPKDIKVEMRGHELRSDMNW